MFFKEEEEKERREGIKRGRGREVKEKVGGRFSGSNGPDPKVRVQTR